MDDFIICGNIYSLNQILDVSREEYHAMGMRALPAKLYKYFPNTANEKGINFSLQALRNNTVHLSSPIQFDDPYDCALTIDRYAFYISRLEYYANVCGCSIPQGCDYSFAVYELSKCIYNALQKEKSLESVFHITGEDDNSVDLNKRTFALTLKASLYKSGSQQDAWQNAFAEALLNEYNNVVKFLSGNFNIACFSTDPYSIRMWSHYANNHKGFCIEYSLTPF